MNQKMLDNKPYSLKSPEGSSDEYYRVIAAFADRWLERVGASLARPVGGFLAYLKQERAFAEAAYEMLVLGVLLREHGAQALQFPLAPAWVLARLVEAQDCLPLPSIEQPVKAMRGFVQGLAAGEPAPDEPVDELPFGEGAAQVVERLVGWLRAQGMTAQADRLAQWGGFMAALARRNSQLTLKLLAFNGFDDAGHVHFGGNAALAPMALAAGVIQQHALGGHAAAGDLPAGVPVGQRAGDPYHAHAFELAAGG